MNGPKNYETDNFSMTKGGFKSEETGGFLLLQNKYSKSLSWAENLNKLFTALGGKFKFSAQDSDLEYQNLVFILEKYFSLFWLKATFSTIPLTYMQ